MKPRELRTGLGDGDLKMHLLQRTDWWLTVRHRVGGGHKVWRVNCIVIDGNQTFSGDYFVTYTDVELQCPTPETYTLYTVLFLFSHSVLSDSLRSPEL